MKTWDYEKQRAGFKLRLDNEFKEQIQPLHLQLNVMVFT